MTEPVREVPRLTARQKRAVAWLLINGAADAAAMFEETREATPYAAELDGVAYEQVAAQFASWLSVLPGDLWDNRLPDPATFRFVSRTAPF